MEKLIEGKVEFEVKKEGLDLALTGVRAGWQKEEELRSMEVDGGQSDLGLDLGS